MEDTDKSIDHPAHYTQGKHEVIELTELLDFCTGNAVKYILRAPYKGQYVRDLKKARWYIEHLADSPYGTTISKKLYDLACEYGSQLLKDIFECLYAARKAGDLGSTPYKMCVDMITKAIHEQEFYEVKRELKRCKEELRKAREEKPASTWPAYTWEIPFEYFSREPEPSDPAWWKRGIWS